MSATATAGPDRDRASIDDRYKWDLSHLYADEATWRAAKAQVESELPALAAFRGRLGASAQTLADALELHSRLDKELSRLYVYASMLSDEDTRAAGPQGMQQEMQRLAAAFGAQAAFIEPEVLRLGGATTLIATEPRLAIYAFYLRDIARRALHTLSDAEERLLADAQPLAAAPSGIYGILANADFPYPTITLQDGRDVRVNQAAYTELRASTNRADRQEAMSSFFGALGAFSRTFGAMMHGEVEKVRFLARARRYDSHLALVLDGPNVPVTVYSRLIDGVNRHLPTLHRYLRLRQRMLGIGDQLHYYDLYAPLVQSVDLTFTPEEAQDLVVASAAPLGEHYTSVLRRSFQERWIDFHPNEGKRAGAYSNGGAYDVHPYMLLNYIGQYHDVSTLAHELGHTMQSYYSNTTQPYALANYPMFVAEVASTFNEALLIEHMLQQVTEPAARRALLGSYLDNVRATVFRQTQFADFEVQMHQMAERGEPITGESLAALYLGITRRYYGHDGGVCVVDDYVAHEWSFIPHFYRDFYVFQYATSFTAAAALAAKVLAGVPGATERYVRFLSAGGSKYPIELLADAGIDMTSDEPLDLTVAKMNGIMDELEAL